MSPQTLLRGFRKPWGLSDSRRNVLLVLNFQASDATHNLKAEKLVMVGSHPSSWVILGPSRFYKFMFPFPYGCHVESLSHLWLNSGAIFATVYSDGETVADFMFLGSEITAGGDCCHEIKRCLFLGRKVMTNLDSILKSRDIVNKGLSCQGYGFSSGHVWRWELDYKES